MMHALKILGLIIFLLAIAQTIAVISFKQFAQTLHTQVANAPAPVLSANPPPELITNYAARAGVLPTDLARVIILSQTAQMRLKRGADWQSLTARQTISTGVSQFVWQAEQYRGPFLMFRVIDGFIADEGRLNVRLFGSIPVADFSGPDADRGEAMRYLAELIWAPDAMLGNPDLKWQEISDSQIGVELALSSGTAQVVFRFDNQGDVIEATAKSFPAPSSGAFSFSHANPFLRMSQSKRSINCGSLLARWNT